VVRVLVDADIPDAVDTNTACVQLHIGMATLYRWINAGKILSVKVGGATLIPLSEITRIQKQEATDSS